MKKSKKFFTEEKVDVRFSHGIRTNTHDPTPNPL